MRILFFILLMSGASAQSSELNERLESVLRSHPLVRADLGLVVMDLAQTPALQIYGLNERQEFIPASVTKLATASSVLQRLGTSFKLQTGLWSAGKVKNGVLDGDLVLKGGGDPGFISETMWYLVNEFTRTGVREINGDIVVDDTAFDDVRDDPSRDSDRADRAYDAPVGAMSFNWNSINIFVRPLQIGMAPRVLLDPLRDYFEVDNKAKTVGGAGSTLEISRVGRKVLVRGSLGVNHDEVVAFKNIDDPADWSGRNLRFFLSQRGISLSGKVRSGRMPASAKLLAKADSKPIGQSIADMLKFSNNFVAEMLTKALAAQDGAAKASLNQGMNLVRADLTSLGVDSQHFTLVSPSGLSRRNRMRPRDLVEILLQARKNFSTFAEFLSALPQAGLDGTLKKRLRDPGVQGWVRAKTGSLAGIVALAGYAGRRDGGLRAFAFIFNGRADQNESARHLFDALTEELVQ